jgi:hypothetical protein
MASTATATMMTVKITMNDRSIPSGDWQTPNS